MTTTSQYIDTGVLLQVTPHINAGGLVTLDVQVEVSSPGPAAQVGDAPPINTRSVQTLVAVPSGRTMVMGGLIHENTRAIPPTASRCSTRIPIFGGLFGNQSNLNDRTELITFITPRVVDAELDNEAVINDLRRRMEMLDRVFPGTSNWPASQPSVSDRAQQLLNPYRYDLPRPAEPTRFAPPVGQPTQTPAAGDPAALSIPLPGQPAPAPIVPPVRPAPVPVPASAAPTPAPAPNATLPVPGAVVPQPAPAGAQPASAASGTVPQPVPTAPQPVPQPVPTAPQPVPQTPSPSGNPPG